MSTYYVVTGAAGLIGSNLVRALNDRGVANIIAVDNLERGAKFANLVDCEIADYFDKRDFLPRVVEGEFDGAEKLLKEIDDAQALGDHHLEKLGSWLLNAAFSARERKAAQWFARKAMNQWQFWAACSTSGGEGAARSREVAKIRKELAGYL